MTTPPNPLTELEQQAAGLSELFRALTAAGVPPLAAAVMLGTMMGTSGAGQTGSDGS